MFRYIIIIFFAVTVITPHATAATSGLRYFACSVLDGAGWTSGELELGDSQKRALQDFKVLLFDEASGILRYRYNNPVKMVILQEGTDQNDLVALYGKEGLARNPIVVLRIRTWDEAPPFILLDEDVGVFTGTCEIK